MYLHTKFYSLQSVFTQSWGPGYAGLTISMGAGHPPCKLISNTIYA